jgi:hypothetical protein
MSLILAAAAMPSVDETIKSSRPRVILKSADQYDLWSTRIAGECWSATRMEVFEVTNEQCDACDREVRSEASGKEKKGQHSIDWVAKCWMLITSAIHDDLFVKLKHVPRGNIPLLLQEIRTALMVDSVEDPSTLRVELYSSSMQKDCGSDLQSYISYIKTRVNKLKL